MRVAMQVSFTPAPNSPHVSVAGKLRRALEAARSTAVGRRPRGNAAGASVPRDFCDPVQVLPSNTGRKACVTVCGTTPKLAHRSLTARPEASFGHQAAQFGGIVKEVASEGLPVPIGHAIGDSFARLDRILGGIYARRGRLPKAGAVRNADRAGALTIAAIQCRCEVRYSSSGGRAACDVRNLRTSGCFQPRQADGGRRRADPHAYETCRNNSSALRTQPAAGAVLRATNSACPQNPSRPHSTQCSARARPHGSHRRLVRAYASRSMRVASPWPRETLRQGAI